MPEIPQMENPISFFVQNAVAIGPPLHLILWGLGVLVLDVLLPERHKKASVWFVLLGLVFAAAHLYWRSDPRYGPVFYRMVTMDSFALTFNVLFLAGAFLSVIMSYKYLDIEREQHTEYYALILFATSGMMIVAASIDLVSLFVGLELMSVSTYILVGFLRSQRRSNEASLKYFLLGAFSTGVILYGMSLLYGLAGSTNLNDIGFRIAQREGTMLLTLALFMMMAGLCFKIAAVPFHMWAPDAYEGAPTSITAFMSVAVKAAAFAMFFRVFHLAFGGSWEVYVYTLAFIAMVTITWGNLAAVTQQNIKRLLAYSSISHAGFILMGLVAGTEAGVAASLVYLFAYTFMNLGAWAVVILLRRQDISGERLEDFDGLFFRHPAIAVLMLVFFLSLAGIPPLAGFIAKYFVFASVLQVALTSSEPYTTLLISVAVVGALNVVISLYYYLRVVVVMFFNKDYLPAPLSFSGGVVVVLVVTGLVTVLMGIYPEPFISLARAAGEALI